MNESLDLNSLIKQMQDSNPAVLKKISQRHISKAKILNKGSRFSKGELRGKEFVLENGIKVTIKTDEAIGKKAQNFIFINGGLSKAKETQKELRELLKQGNMPQQEKRAALSLKKAIDEYVEYRTKTNKASKMKKQAAKKDAKKVVEKVNPQYLNEVQAKIDEFFARDLNGLSENDQASAYAEFIEELENEKRRITAESAEYREKMQAQIERLELLKRTTSDYTSQDFIDTLQEIADDKNATMPIIDNMAQATELINQTVESIRPKSFPNLSRAFDSEDMATESSFVLKDTGSFSDRFKVNFYYIGRFFHDELDRKQRKQLRQASYAAQKYGREGTIDDLNIFERFFSGLPLRGNNQRAMRSLDIETVDIFELFNLDEDDVQDLKESGYLQGKLVRRPIPRAKTPIIDFSKVSSPKNDKQQDLTEDLDGLFAELDQ